MKNNIMLVVGGLVVFIIGLALTPTVVGSAMTATQASTGIGSFGGVQGIVSLLPLIFVIGLLVVGLGAMVTGGIKAAKG